MNMRTAKLWSGALTVVRQRPFILAALAVLLVDRALPTGLGALDLVLGRSGDSALLLAVFLLLAAMRRLPAVASVKKILVAPPPAVAPGLQDLLETHLELDRAMDQKLLEVVDDTENSALAIITQVRGLYDSADLLVRYLEHSSPQANSLGNDIVNSVSYLVDISTFIQELPDKMMRDLHGVQSVVKEITELSSLVGSVQAISMQSHLLAINAAIEGSRAGPSGAAFRVVAQEMRLLAANSGAVASQISEGLLRARTVVEGGMSTRMEASTKALNDVSHAVVSIQKLQENFEDMSQYFKTRFAVITQHNQNLSRDIAEVLGHIQYQDVVGQCIQRLRAAIAQRNAMLQSATDPLQPGRPDARQLQSLLMQILKDFVEEEAAHKHSARHDEKDGGELKFEIF